MHLEHPLSQQAVTPFLDTSGDHLSEAPEVTVLQFILFAASKNPFTMTLLVRVQASCPRLHPSKKGGLFLLYLKCQYLIQ
jgi:hypothetical protein